jgi:plastocyanin
MSALSKLLLLAGFAAHAMAITIPVKVGEVGLTFEPNEIRAHKDDVIEFRFYALNHSVVAGNFDEACTPAEEGGFFSSFNFPTARTNPPTANVSFVLLPVPLCQNYPFRSNSIFAPTSPSSSA